MHNKRLFTAGVITLCMLAALFALAFFSSGLAPRLFRFKHVVLHAAPRVDIAERSNESNDSQGKPLRGAKIALPIKSTVEARGHIVSIFTPLNSFPVVFLRVENNREMLNLRGRRLREIDKTAGIAVVHGYTHIFDVDFEAKSSAIEFEIVTREGAVVAHEKVGYDLVLRGYKWESPL